MKSLCYKVGCYQEVIDDDKKMWNDITKLYQHTTFFIEDKDSSLFNLYMRNFFNYDFLIVFWILYQYDNKYIFESPNIVKRHNWKTFLRKQST